MKPDLGYMCMYTVDLLSPLYIHDVAAAPV